MKLATLKVVSALSKEAISNNGKSGIMSAKQELRLDRRLNDY